MPSRGDIPVATAVTPPRGTQSGVRTTSLRDPFDRGQSLIPASDMHHLPAMGCSFQCRSRVQFCVSPDNAGLGQQHSHLLDVFIEDFCSQVKSALRGGAIARYSERTENRNAIRGRLELTEHLRTNAFDRSHLLCRFDERSIDNAYNQALKDVLRIWRVL